MNLIMAVNTHCHADHITGTNKLKTHFPAMKSVIAEAAGADADIKINEGDKIVFGSRHVLALATPGHTAVCRLLDD
jgi:sulfur dioxygenase